MKLLRFLTSIFFFFAVTCMLNAQEFKVPEDISLENKEDFAKYKMDVLKCIDWLAITPIHEDVEKRAEANRFLLTWLAGTDEVSIGISIIIKEVVRKNPDLIMTYMGGWARYALNHSSIKPDIVALNKAGIISSIEVYELNLTNGFKKNKKIEKLKARDQNGTLEDWIIKKLEIE
jgi:hypothetical protein